MAADGEQAGVRISACDSHGAWLRARAQPEVEVPDRRGTRDLHAEHGVRVAVQPGPCDVVGVNVDVGPDVVEDPVPFIVVVADASRSLALRRRDDSQREHAQDGSLIGHSRTAAARALGMLRLDVHGRPGALGAQTPCGMGWLVLGAVVDGVNADAVGLDVEPVARCELTYRLARRTHVLAAD